MEEYILNEIYIKDNILSFISTGNAERLFIANKSSKFEQPVIEGSFNLLTFIKQHEMCLQDESIFSLLTIQEEKHVTLTLPSVSANSSVYRGAEIKTDKYIYIINLLVNENNELLLNIQRKRTNIVNINITDLYISDKTFNMTIEKVGTRFINEIGIILTNSLGETKGITCSTSKGNSATFSIDLQDLIRTECTTFATNLILDGEIVPLHFNDDFTFKKEVFIENSNLSIITPTLNEFGNLSFDITNELQIQPIVSEVKYINNVLLISGRIYSNINYHTLEGYKTFIKFISSNNSKSVIDDLPVNNGKFEYELSAKELLELKDANTKEWNIAIGAQRDDIEVTCVNVSGVESFPELTQPITFEGSSALLQVISNRDLGLQLLVTGALNIEQILSIQRRGNKILVKYRTSENVERLIKNKRLCTDIIVGNTTLKCKKIILRGKKTYSCTYNSKDSNSILDTILEKGLTIVSRVQNVTVSQNMPEVNEMAVYRNFKEACENTKKYKKFTSTMYQKVFLKLPVNQNKVMLESFLGRNVSGQPKYLYEHMVKKGMDYNHKFIWILNDLDEEIPGKHKKVKRKSLQYYYHMATSGKWIFNTRQADEIVKRPETTYLQTWHGTCLKRLAGDMTSVDMGGKTDIEEYRNKFFKNTSRWDYLLAQNDYSKEIFKRAFNFKKDIIMGYPANDILYTKNNPSDIDKMKDKLNLPKDKKVILYAPTWRDDNFYKKGHYKLNLELELDKMKKELGQDYIVLIRAHYLIANSINLADYEGFAYDFSKGHDIQELYLVSDILVTDYSSTMFDYANLKRPMIFFTYDLEKYRDNLRGFYFDFEATAPGPIVKTTDGVINSIKNIDSIQEEYKELSKAFYNKFCHIDNGNSAEKVVNTLFKK